MTGQKEKNNNAEEGKKRQLGLSGLSVQSKLSLIIVITSAVALLGAGTLFILIQRYSLKEHFAKDLLALTRLTGKENVSFLKAGDSKEANNNLLAFSVHPTITAVIIHDREGKLFARYVKKGDDEANPLFSGEREEGFTFLDDALILTQPIISDNKKIGVVTVVESMEHLWSLEVKSVIVAMAVFILFLLAAWLFSLRVRRMIPSPLTDLLDIAQGISRNHDFSRRAARNNDGELDVLVDAFNEMLDQIKERDDKLKYHREGLEKEVEQRTAELLEEKERAEEANRLKDKFVSLVSHDLRSPIASSIVYLGRIRADESGKDRDLQKNLLLRCVNGMKRMLGMIDSLLSINRLQGGEIRLVKSFENVRLVSSQVVGALLPLAEEKGVVIENRIKDGTRIYAASDLLEEVLRNLIANAIKFCEKDDQISIYTPDGAPSTIAVNDTGVGINEDMLGSLFRKEVKTTTLGTMGELGSGLGLLFCSDIMAAHSGAIRAESQEGVGATFFIEFPDVKPVVLVVDDQASVRQTFIELLDSLDVVVTEAADGVEALEHIEKQRPHLIIADIFMPRMDGFELLERVKGDENIRDIPTIIATSQAGVEVRERVFKSGANDYVSKPVMEEDFIPRVRRFIG